MPGRAILSGLSQDGVSRERAWVWPGPAGHARKRVSSLTLAKTVPAKAGTGARPRDQRQAGRKTEVSPPMTSIQDPDAKWLERFAAGDPRAARALTDSLAPRSYAVALRVLGDAAAAEDVAQDAMMRLWRVAPDWESGSAKVSTWLYRVTLNLCIDLKRRRRGGMASIDEVAEPADPAPTAPEQMQDAARVDALQVALMQLPERQREAVVLRHIEELSNPEIAGIMDISTEAVESLTARGKRALAGLLAGRREELGYEHG